MLRNVASLMLALAVLLTVGSLSASAAEPETEAANDALDYVRTLQNADGGFPFVVDGDSEAGATVDAVLALVAADVNPSTVQSSDSSPADHLASQADSYSDTAGGAAKLVMGAAALGVDPRVFGGVDVLAEMDANYDAGTGEYRGYVFDQALFLLAQASVERTAATAAVDYLKSKQLGSGGWEYSDTWGADTNTTAMAIMGLIAAGENAGSTAVQDALTYLAGAQNDDGGWPYDPVSPWGTDSDANSTALVIQALVAAGEEIDDWHKEGTTPLDALIAFQLESGALEWQPGFGANPLATYQVVPALLLQPFPVATMTLEEEEQEEEKKTATPKPTKTPTATAIPTTSPTATLLPPVATPTVVAPPLSAVPTAEVAGITIAPAGVGVSAGREGGAAVATVVAFLLVGGGALMTTGGLALRMRRR